MLPGPVFNVELLTSARRRRYYVIRALYGLSLLLLLSSSYASMAVVAGQGEGRLSPNLLAVLGRRMFHAFATVQAIAVLGLTPALVAGTIADEARRKTLHYLLASRLSGGEIVLGKLFARLLHVAVLMAVGLPVMNLLTLFGGIDPPEVLAAYAATATTAFFLASLSILVSTVARRPRDAIFRAYGLVFLWLALPPIVAHVVPATWPRVAAFTDPINDWIYPTSPFWLMESAGSLLSTRSFGESLAWTCGLQMAYGALAVALAVWRLRPSYRAEGGGRRGRFKLARKGPSWRLFPRPPCGERPMLWKELQVRRSAGIAKFLELAVGLGILGGLGHGVYELAPDAFREALAGGYGSSSPYLAREAFNAFLRAVETCLYGVAALGVAAHAAGSLTGEREGDTWISLVATDLTDAEILLGKMAGAIWAVRWILAATLGLSLVGMAAGSLHPLGFLANVVETAVFLVFAAAVGAWFSLRSKTTIGALGSTIALLLFLNGGYLICGSPLAFLMRGGDLGIYLAMGVTPMIYAMSLLSFEDTGRLLTPDGRSSELSVQAAGACLLGTIGYALAAILLTQSAIARFGRAVGRPEREGQVAPPFRARAGSPPAAAPPPPPPT